MVHAPHDLLPANKQPRRIQLEIHKTVAPFLKKKKKPKNQATRDAVQTRIIRRIWEIPRAIHSFKQSHVNSWMARQSWELSGHCVIVTKPTSRDLGLSKKLAFIVWQDVRESTTMTCEHYWTDEPISETELVQELGYRIVKKSRDVNFARQSLVYIGFIFFVNYVY